MVNIYEGRTHTAMSVTYKEYKELCVERGIYPKGEIEFMGTSLDVPSIARGMSLLDHVITILKLVPVKKPDDADPPLVA